MPGRQLGSWLVCPSPQMKGVIVIMAACQESASERPGSVACQLLQTCSSRQMKTGATFAVPSTQRVCCVCVCECMQHRQGRSPTIGLNWCDRVIGKYSGQGSNVVFYPKGGKDVESLLAGLGAGL